MQQVFNVQGAVSGGDLGGRICRLEAAVCRGLPGLLPAQRVDGAVGRIGAGVYDCGGAGELSVGWFFCQAASSKENKVELTRVRRKLVRPEPGDELANGWPLPYNQNFA
jgi:hypothetical protein